MALKRIIDLPEDLTPDPDAYLPTDDFTDGSKRSTISSIVNAAATGLFQPLNANLTTLAGVTPGAAGLAILADPLPADTRTYLSAVVRVADKTALKALDTTKDTLAMLPGDDAFDWTAGDFTTAQTYDPNEHIIVKATAIAITAGAWVKRIRGDRPDIRADFGAVGDSRSCGAGTITAATTTLTVADSEFTAADVGKAISIQGAGVAAVLPDTINTLHVTTIASVTNSTTVELTDAAISTTTGTSSNIVWVGTDDTQAVQDAINWMEYYPQRTRALFASRGDYLLTSTVLIPNDITGISITGASYWDTNFRGAIAGLDPEVDGMAFKNMSQEFKLFNLSGVTTGANSDNNEKGRIFLRNDKGPGLGDAHTADIDCVIGGGVRIAGWGFGIYHKGRSLMVRGHNHFASCGWAIGFDWYDEGDYEPDDDQGTDLNGFRGNIVEGIRVHSPFSGGIWNDGDNKHKMSGLKIANVTLDIGRTIFRGDMGLNGSIIGCSSMMCPTTVPALILTGGVGGVVDGLVAGGTRKITGAPPVGVADYAPNNIVQITGDTFRGMVFSNWSLAFCREHAIRDNATQLDGVIFSNINCTDVGFDTPASWRCISIGSQNSNILVENIMFNGTDTLNAIVGNNNANSTVRVVNPRRSVGNTTSYITGPSITVNRRRSYAPTLTNTTNITTSSLPTVDYIDLDDDYMMLTGRATVTASTASAACVLRISLPSSFDITDANQVSGVWACSSPGAPSSVGGIFGDVTNNVMEVRWTPDVNTSQSYQLDVKLRRS